MYLKRDGQRKQENYSMKGVWGSLSAFIPLGRMSPPLPEATGCRMIGIYGEVVPEAWCLVSGPWLVSLVGDWSS